jgi:hypothetical protein
LSEKYKHEHALMESMIIQKERVVEKFQAKNEKASLLCELKEKWYLEGKIPAVQEMLMWFCFTHICLLLVIRCY